MFPTDQAKPVIEYFKNQIPWGETVRAGLLAVSSWAAPLAKRPETSRGPKVQTMISDPVPPGQKMASLLDQAIQAGELPADFDYFFLSEYGFSILSAHLGR